MTMTWRDLLDQLRRADLLISAPEEGPAPTGVVMDSRTAARGQVYVAVRGSQADGHRFVADAVGRGVAAVVIEQPGAAAVPEIVVRDGRRAALVLGAAWYGHPGRRLTLVGITGTNGKTTTTGLLRHLLDRDGDSGSIGTLGAFDGRGEPVSSTAGSLTTPGPIDLQATLAAMLDRGCTSVTMEASSHSLDQGRLDGLTFTAGVFTNLTRDHLDYHHSMESYLGREAPAGRPADGAGGRGGEPGRRGVARASGAPPAHHLRTPPGRRPPRQRHRARRGRQPVPGLGMLRHGGDIAAAARGFQRPQRARGGRVRPGPGAAPGRGGRSPGCGSQVPGRMERIAERPGTILRDYAHTPDALERALATLRPLTRGRLIVVFGCGGDRDRGKRPLMGRIAAELADLAVVTSDNPRTEDPGSIIDDVEQGMGDIPHRRVVDRLEAIQQAVAEARAGDTVLLAGKGHETYQVVGTEKVSFDEREIVARLVKDPP